HSLYLPSFPTRRSSDLTITMTTPVVSSGQVSFNYSTDAGLRYSLQSTSDLVNWSSGPTNVAATSSVPVTQAVVPSFRFYRVARLDRKSTRLNSSHVAIS